MGLLTPEEALTRYRAGGETQEERDWLANEFFANFGSENYGAKGYQPGGLLSPQEQMQIEWLRAQKGQNSGNNKDDRIKRIRKLNDLDKERFEGEQRFITRNKVDQAGRADGITAGDVFGIGDYTQSDTGKDDGLVQQIINKGLPGFDVGDVTSIPGIDWVALAAAPYTGGISTAVLEGLKAAEAGKIGPETVAAIVGAAGGWDSVLAGLKNAIPAGAAGALEIPEWLDDAYNYGKETYDTVANHPIIQGAQDIYGNIRDFTDPIEDIFGSVTDIFGEFDAPEGLAAFMPQKVEKTELLPLEYTGSSDLPFEFMYNPFEGSIV